MNPGEQRPCEACGEELIGARTRTGKVAPITVQHYEDGNVLLHRVHERTEGIAGVPHGIKVVCAWVLAGDTLEKARENGVELRRNHFYGCPDAQRFRASKQGGDGGS